MEKITREDMNKFKEIFDLLIALATESFDSNSRMWKDTDHADNTAINIVNDDEVNIEIFDCYYIITQGTVIHIMMSYKMKCINLAALQGVDTNDC